MARKSADVVFSLVLLGVVTGMAWEARKWDARASLFPLVIGIPAVAVGFLQLGFAIRKLRAIPAQPSPATSVAASANEADVLPMPASPAEQDPTVAPQTSAAIMADAVERAFGAGSAMEEEQSVPPALARRRTLEMCAWIVGITAGIVVLGFEFGAAVVSFAFLRFPGKESARTSLTVAVLTYLFFYLVFDRALNIPFPAGVPADLAGLTEPLDHYVMDPLANLLSGR